MLSSLLAHADDDPQTAALVRDGGRAFVSQSLRPYLIAALLDRDPDRPAIVVAGDDRGARDLAAGLRTWLEPRTVRYYPSRHIRIAPGSPAAPRRPADRRARCAARAGRRPGAGRRRQRGGAVGESARPGVAPAQLHAADR